MREHRVGILFSGGGTTAEAMVKAVQESLIPQLKIVCAIASTPKAEGINKLQQLNIPVSVISPTDFKQSSGKIDQIAFGNALLAILQNHQVTVITQNGWIPLTPQNVVERFEGNIFNQHPGPLPEFGGKGMMGKTVHDAFLRFRRKVNRPIDTYVLAHRVTTGLDEGQVVKRTIVAVYDTDTPDTLQQRALPLEHQTQIALLTDIAHYSVKELPPIVIAKKNERQLLTEAKQEAVTAK